MKFYLKESNSDYKLIMGKLYDAQFSDGRFVYSTGERISEKDWTQPKKGTGKPKKGFEDLQERLLEITKQATAYIRLNRANLTKEGLKNHLDALRPKEVIVKKEPVDKPKSLLDLWAEYLDAINGTVSKDTLYNYTNSRAIMVDFLTEKKWQEIAVDKFTLTHFKKFQAHLNEKYSNNQQAKVLKHFKQALNYIMKLKHSIGFDVEEITYKEKPGLKISLSEEELQGYIDVELEGRLDQVRDLIVLQCNNGPRISDLKRLDKNIRNDRIILETQKNQKGIEIPITPITRRILEKYNYQLPKISEQEYRQGIKTIYKKLYPDKTIQVREKNGFRTVPVHEEISSHDMVRTFITLSHERGMSVNSIAKITGKTVKVLLNNYLVESQKVADKEMEKAWGSSPLRIAK